MDEAKKLELFNKVKAKCHKRSLALEDDTIKDTIERFYQEYNTCENVDNIVVLLTCNECQTEENSNNSFDESKIVEASYWDIKTKYKGYDGVPYSFVKSQYGIEAYQLIEQCKQTKLIEVSVRL